MRFWSLQDSVPYREVRKLQLRLVEDRAADRIPDTILFLEHDPVVTRGRGLQFSAERICRHLPVTNRASWPDGIDFEESERGGDLTYHGPGQLICYPICKLVQGGAFPRHVSGFLRILEEIAIEALANWRIRGVRRENASGVWVEDGDGSLRKLASVGIAVKHWVTYHGIALNCVNDLAPFRLISPCGFDPSVMTRVADLRTECICGENRGSWREILEKEFVSGFAKRAGFGGEFPEIKKIRLVSSGATFPKPRAAEEVHCASEGHP